MEPDDTICFCYRVSLRKLLNFARRERPQHAARMSECLGAGTGCGWCVPILRQIASAGGDLERFPLDLTPEEHAAGREAYRREAASHGDRGLPEESSPAG